jgi:hypothetical protein
MSRRWLTGGDFPVILPPACCGQLRDPPGPGASCFAGAARPDIRMRELRYFYATGPTLVLIPSCSQINLLRELWTAQ